MTTKLFEEKTAREKPYQYDGCPDRNGASWRSDTFDYFVAKCPAAAPWLDWAERRGSAEITPEELHRVMMDGQLMTDDLNPVVLSHHIWAFLQHCLTGPARQVYKSTRRQDGLNVWRKLTQEINSRTDCVRHRLRNQCQTFRQAPSNATLWKCIADWESLYIEYLDAGGSHMGFEDRRGQLIGILPREIRREVFRRLNEFRDIAGIKEWIRQQLELERDWNATDQNSRPRAVGLVGRDGDDFDIEGGENLDNPSGGEPEELDMEALFALTADSTTAEINAVQQRFRRFGRGPGGGGRGAPGAARGRGPPAAGSKPSPAKPSGGASTTKCINCGKTGHPTRNCPEARKDPKERPCFGCGKVGHVRAQCPAAKKTLGAATVHFGRLEVLQPSEAQRRSDAARQPPKGHFKPSGTPANSGEAVKAGGDPSGETSRARNRPRPSQTVLGDYLKPSAFVQLGRLNQKEARDRAASSEDSDNEDWVEDFEVKYPDVTRMPAKEKHKEAAAKTAWRSARAKGRLDQECCVMEIVYPEETQLLAADADVPQFTTLKVALDSGAGAHVINKRDAPGYQVQPSAMSKSGAAFLAADGGRIANYGEVTVNMLSHDSKGGTHRISSRFEAADVTRALWSVGLICDSGLDVQFSAENAVVRDKEGRELCVFQRTNGLYVTEVQIENPGFHRPGF